MRDMILAIAVQHLIDDGESQESAWGEAAQRHNVSFATARDAWKTFRAQVE